MTTSSEKSQVTDLVTHLHSLLSQVFAPIFEDANTHNTRPTSLVFSVKELVDNVGSLLSSIVSHLQQDETVVDVDAALSPAVRILSVVQTKKRNGADDAQYKRLINTLPELRDLAINYSARVLSLIGPCFWNQRTVFTDKLLKHASDGLYLGDFFVTSGFAVGKDMNDILVRQVQEKVQRLVTMIKDVKTWEPPALGRKRKKHSPGSSLVFDTTTFNTICGIVPLLTVPNTLILDLILLYQQMFVHKLGHRTRLLHALVENMVSNYSAEFHPYISLLLHCLQCEQNEVDVDGLVKRVQLIVHPRRLPYPLRAEPGEIVGVPDGKQTEIVDAQRPILPFPELLTTTTKGQDVSVVLQPTITPETTTLHPTISEQSNTLDLDEYMAELDAKIQNTRNTINTLPSEENILYGQGEEEEEVMPLIVDVPSD